jgi:hypothetical protein
MRLNNPAPGRPVTSGYGMRRHPISGNVRMHTGIDYGGVFNVLAAGDGIVQAVGANLDPARGFGHWVRINHGNRLYTFYAHGATASNLKKGQRVKTGDRIFRSGTSGAATGPHLHFEVRDGSPLQASHKDPNPYFNKPETPSNPLRVTGKENKATWLEWQRQLKERWGYRGIVDGIPGRLTIMAIQRSIQPHGYTGPVAGNLGPNTRRGVQQKLANQGYYTGRIDGVWGPLTWSAIQRCLNEGKY